MSCHNADVHSNVLVMTLAHLLINKSWDFSLKKNYYPTAFGLMLNPFYSGNANKGEDTVSKIIQNLMCFFFKD